MIIDSYLSITSELKKKKIDSIKYCFICGEDREVLDRNTKGFLAHIKVFFLKNPNNYPKIDHNMWNYAYYKTYLELKKKNQFNGIESYIYDKINQFDMSWFPVQRFIDHEHNKLIEKKNSLMGVIDANVFTYSLFFLKTFKFKQLKQNIFEIKEKIQKLHSKLLT